MKKTLQVNIGGYPFNVDQDTYSQVELYLGEVRRCYQGNSDASEILEDIEERFGELLKEKCSGDVISASDVQYAISVLGTPGSFGTGETEDGAPHTAAAIRKKLYRNPEGKLICGVCSGLATYLNWDVAVIRLLWIILALALLPTESFFIEPAVYLILCIAMPKADTVQRQCELRGDATSARGIGEQYQSNRRSDSKPALHTLGRVLGIILGILLFISGLGALCFGALCSVVPAIFAAETGIMAELMEEFADVGLNLNGSGFGPLSFGTAFTAVFAYALPCLLAMYYGILLALSLQSPRWRPGLVVLIVWAVSLVLFCVFVGIDIAKFASPSFMVP